MAKSRRVVAAPDTPTPGVTETARPLPEELLSEQVQRLALFAAVAGTVWAVGLLMETVVMPSAGVTGVRNYRAIALEFFTCLAAAVMCFYLRTSHATPQKKTD